MNNEIENAMKRAGLIMETGGDKSVVSGMDFGEAIRAIKDGKKVARENWNGKNMFLYFVPAGNYSPCTDVAKEVADVATGLVPYAPYIAMKTAQGYVVPWLASQTDILATDWTIV